MVSLVLCVTDVCAMSESEGILYEETKAGTEESAFGELEISTPSAVLMEVSTGKVIYEKAADEQLPPASVTKVMTLLLIFDALEDEKIKLTDIVSVSEYAASMGGSQVFLEPGETQTVDTMIKCIAVASANDACVAMAEHIWGSEKEFVAKMNARAKELGMEHTNFLNCNGLDADGHVTTARDIALMSRELITRYTENSRLFYDMDGKHYTYDQEGDNGVWPCEYQQTDQTISVCDRTKDRLDKQGKILSVSNCKER